jgi:hypothetical protein
VIVNCPACGKQGGVPDDAAGKRVACPSCNTVFQAGNPVATPVAAPVPPPTTPPPRRRWLAAGPRVEGEPWYYWFVSGYAKIILLLSALALLCSCAMPPVAGFLGVMQYNQFRQPSGYEIGGLILLALIMAVMFVVSLLPLTFVIALILVFVDMARNVRGMRQAQGDGK